METLGRSANFWLPTNSCTSTFYETSQQSCSSSTSPSLIFQQRTVLDDNPKTTNFLEGVEHEKRTIALFLLLGQDRTPLRSEQQHDERRKNPSSHYTMAFAMPKISPHPPVASIVLYFLEKKRERTNSKAASSNSYESKRQKDKW